MGIRARIQLCNEGYKFWAFLVCLVGFCFLKLFREASEDLWIFLSPSETKPHKRLLTSTDHSTTEMSSNLRDCILLGKLIPQILHKYC